MIGSTQPEYRADMWTIRVATIVIAVMMVGAGALVAVQIQQQVPVSPFLTLFLGAGLIGIRSLFIEKKTVDAMNGINDKVNVAAGKALETSERGKLNHKLLLAQNESLEQQKASFEYFDNEVQRIHTDHARISREHALILDEIRNLKKG